MLFGGGRAIKKIMQRVEFEKNHASIWGKKKIPETTWNIQKYRKKFLTASTR
jgi:hypothetical protein